MSFDPVLVGTTANDGTGDPLRTAFTRVNSNFGLAVEGPATATSGRVAVYDGTTGKLLQDGTKLEADLVVGPAAATDGAVALYDSTTGKLIKDGPVPGAANGLATLDSFSRHLISETPLQIVRGFNNPFDTVRYFNSHTAPVGNGAIANQFRIVTTATYLPKGVVTNFRVEITTASTDAGAKIRLGLYDGFGNLVVDAGQIEADSLGVKTLTTSVSIAAGIYFTAYLLQDIVTSVPSTPRFSGINTNAFSPKIDSSGAAVHGWTTDAIFTGVLPSSFTVTGTALLAPLVYVGVTS
jgi:hypothetical protein